MVLLIRIVAVLSVVAYVSAAKDSTSSMACSCIRKISKRSAPHHHHHSTTDKVTKYAKSNARAATKTKPPKSTTRSATTTATPVTTTISDVTTATPVTTTISDITTATPVTTTSSDVTTAAPVMITISDVTTDAPVTTTSSDVTTDTTPLESTTTSENIPGKTLGLPNSAWVNPASVFVGLSLVTGLLAVGFLTYQHYSVQCYVVPTNL